MKDRNQNQINPIVRRAIKTLDELDPFKNFLDKREWEKWKSFINSFDRFLNNLKNKEISPHSQKVDAAQMGESVCEMIGSLSTKLDFIDAYKREAGKRAAFSSLQNLAGLVEKNLTQVPKDYKPQFAKAQKELKAFLEKAGKKIVQETKKETALSSYLFSFSEKLLEGGASSIRVGCKIREHGVLKSEEKNQTKAELAAGAPLFGGDVQWLEYIQFSVEDTKFKKIGYDHLRELLDQLAPYLQGRGTDALVFQLHLQNELKSVEEHNLLNTLQALESVERGILIQTDGNFFRVRWGSQILMVSELVNDSTLSYLKMVFDLRTDLRALKGYINGLLSFFEGKTPPKTASYIEF